MKKFLALLLTLSMIICFAACGKEKATGGIPNPIKSYESLAEINEISGGKLSAPGVMGVVDTAYNIIEGEPLVAEYKFTVNGYECTFRFSPAYDVDICGVYGKDGTAFDGTTAGEVQYAEVEGYKLSRWANIDGQYVFMIKDEGTMEQETFEGTTEELMSIVAPGMSNAEKQAFYDAIAGEYFDKTSERAVAEVESCDGYVSIEVAWGSSASEVRQWTMTATLDEDGLLSYNDEAVVDIVFSEEGAEEVTVISENGSGSFSYSEETGLAWTGSADASCVDCIFEKVE